MQIHRHISLILPLALLILLSACSNGMKGAAEIALPTQVWDAVLFQDDFSNPKSGWDRASQGGNSTDYADGKYRITLATPQQDIWANPYQYFNKDIIVEVDAWQNPSTAQAAYGIICGYSDVNNFYALTVGSGGYWRYSDTSKASASRSPAQKIKLELTPSTTISKLNAQAARCSYG